MVTTNVVNYDSEKTGYQDRKNPLVTVVTRPFVDDHKTKFRQRVSEINRNLQKCILTIELKEKMNDKTNNSIWKAERSHKKSNVLVKLSDYKFAKDNIPNYNAGQYGTYSYTKNTKYCYLWIVSSETPKFGKISNAENFNRNKILYEKLSQAAQGKS